jgi:hypothetical protein
MRTLEMPEAVYNIWNLIALPFLILVGFYLYLVWKEKFRYRESQEYSAELFKDALVAGVTAMSILIPASLGLLFWILKDHPPESIRILNPLFSAIFLFLFSLGLGLYCLAYLPTYVRPDKILKMTIKNKNLFFPIGMSLQYFSIFSGILLMVYFFMGEVGIEKMAKRDMATVSQRPIRLILYEARDSDARVAGNIYFDPNEVEIKEEYKFLLDSLCSTLKKGREKKIEIRGYVICDDRKDYKEAELTTRRADALRIYIINQKVCDNRIVVKIVQ